MWEQIKNFFDSSAFMPHGHCYLWRPEVLWLNAGSDLVIALSYFSIPIALVVFVKKRKDLVFNWIFRLFAAFIMACGVTHLVEIWTVWNPDYVVQGLVKLYTAGVSFVTAFLLWPLMPKALKLPSPDALLQAKRDLELRVEERTTELRRANKMKDEFLSTLSHELRTPLNVIMGYTDLLKIETPNSDDFKQALDSINRNARIQAALIDDLLDVSRIITGKIQLDTHLIDPAAIIKYAIDAVRLSAEAKQIKVETKFDELTGFVLGDSTRLQQVLWNLLSNAVKFSDKGSVIEVSSRRFESKLEIKVKDQGLGIDPEFLPFVFERFRQQDASTTRVFGGLGLGLAIVRHIVELHGGMVFAESAGKGQGATFTVLLPIMTVSPQRVDQSGHIAHIPGGLTNSAKTSNDKPLRDVKILVIDDETDTRVLVRALLVRAGAEVQIAESAAEARQILKAWLPNVIISDVGMRDEDGFDFVRNLREAKDLPESQLPAIALTAYARNEDRDAALEAGFTAHASKPIGAPQLVEVVLSVLRNP